MNQKNIIQKSFSIQAENFETDKMNFSKEEYLNFVISKMNLNFSYLGLEVAAGTCALGCSIAPYVKIMTCLDLTEKMLEVGKNKNKDNMIFVKGEAENLPFLDESFDFVVSRLAFHHFVDIDKTFKEMKRVLKRHGKIILIDMITYDNETRFTMDEIEKMRDFSHIKNLTENEILNLYKNNNVSVEYKNNTEIEVSLDSWLELTKTSEITRKSIINLIKDDILGGNKTGFNPYLKNNQIFFNQNWFMVLGVKL